MRPAVEAANVEVEIELRLSKGKDLMNGQFRAPKNSSQWLVPLSTPVANSLVHGLGCGLRDVVMRSVVLRLFVVLRFSLACSLLVWVCAKMMA